MKVRNFATIGGSGGDTIISSGSGGMSVLGVMHLVDQKDSITAGGTAIAGTQTRVLNTEITNTINGASLASNVISLPAGKYTISITAPALKVDRHQVLLVNDSTEEIIAYGNTSWSHAVDSYSTTLSTLNTYLEVEDTINIRVDHYTRQAKADNGLGLEQQTNFSRYTEVFIQQVDSNVSGVENTVLYDGALVPANSSVPLSESYNNFDYLVVYGYIETGVEYGSVSHIATRVFYPDELSTMSTWSGVMTYTQYGAGANHFYIAIDASLSTETSLYIKTALEGVYEIGGVNKVVGVKVSRAPIVDGPLVDVEPTEFSETTNIASSGTILRADGGIQGLTMTSDTTIVLDLTEGQALTLHLNGGDTWTVTWPTITWVGGSAPTLTAADVIEFWYFNGVLFGAYGGTVA